MRQSIELLQRALEKQTLSAWARDFNVVPSTFTNAKRVGRLSPALAGNLAIELGEDPRDWIAIAAIEAEKDSPLLQRLKAREKTAAEAVTAKA
jgi:hypothetical protein